MLNEKGLPFIHNSDVAGLAVKGMKVLLGFSTGENFSLRLVTKEGQVINTQTGLKRHKEDKVKYMILQFENIGHENVAETAS
ncbi:MAG: hypothetical protein ABUK01_12275 [Leptospirales bacterium]